MSRRVPLPEPLNALEEKAGGSVELRRLMGGVPVRTLYRWASTIRSFGTEALPRSAKVAINQAESALRRKK